MEIDTAAPAPPAAPGGRTGSRGATGEGQGAAPFLSLLAALQPAADALSEPAAVQGEAPPKEEALPLDGEESPVEGAVPMVAPPLDTAVQEPRAQIPDGLAVLPQRAQESGPRPTVGFDVATRAAVDEAARGLEERGAAEPAPEASAEAASASALSSAAGHKARPAGSGWQPWQEPALSGQPGETRQLQRQAQGAELQATAEARGGNTAAQAASTTAASALAEAWSGTGRPQQVARGAERHAERGAQQPLSTVALAAGSADATVQGNGAAMAPTAASALVPAGNQATATLAEKMRFWSLRGVQNATLELEAFDGARVDVHIAVQGREAKVEFRSDVPEARRWLQEALPQLEDMLQGQGIALAGGFVGTGAEQRDEAALREQGGTAARSGIVRVGVADAQALQAATTPAPARGMGHTVDLFV